MSRLKLAEVIPLHSQPDMQVELECLLERVRSGEITSLGIVAINNQRGLSIRSVGDNYIALLGGISLLERHIQNQLKDEHQ